MGSSSCGPTIHRSICRGLVGVRGESTGTLPCDTWNVTSLVGKEPELVREVVRCQLDIVCISRHESFSGTSFLERGFILFHSGVALGERWRWGGRCGYTCIPRLCCLCIGDFPGFTGGLPHLYLKVFCYWTCVLTTVCP